MTQRVALITGAGRRFGFELAKALLAEDYLVLAHYNTSKAGIDELEALGAIGIQADLADLNQVQTLIQTVQKQTLKLDLLVNNASCFFTNEVVDENLSHLDAVFRVHTITPYLLITGLRSELKEAGAALVLNITDIYVDSPSTDYLAYCAAKAGLANLTEGFAKALAPEIRVNAIQPGPILFLPEHDSEHRRTVLEQTPLNVEGGLQPMIETVRFLRDNPFITGESIKVDGGRALNI
ncbi:MAG TPA: SDR family NAD(P)-dependent oxidoreductase [Pseudidiomarina sp.]|nr:SDR family NAD(P)-dependent oxidoreductase [Pseudidiomarina sp.]